MPFIGAMSHLYSEYFLYKWHLKCPCRYPLPRGQNDPKAYHVGSKYHDLPCTSISKTVDLQNILLSGTLKIALSTDVNFGTEKKVGWRPDCNCPFHDGWHGLAWGFHFKNLLNFLNPFIFKNK